MNARNVQLGGRSWVALRVYVLYSNYGPGFLTKGSLSPLRHLRQAYAAPSTRNREKQIGVIGVTMVADSSLVLFVRRPRCDDGIFCHFDLSRTTIHTYFRH